MHRSLFNKIVTSNLFFENLYRSYRKWKKRRPYRKLSNEAIFTKVYQSNAWGTNNENPKEFYSGPGSYGIPAEQYANTIKEIILSYNITSITDIGCGDFAIGKRITEASPLITYNGCDVVKPLIERNWRMFGNDKIKFQHLDAVVNEFPAADLLTIREVLQHLSNDEIKKVLSKAAKFKYVVVTEHLFSDRFVKTINKDKPAGPDLRLVDMSGVYIDKPPFNLKCTEILSCRSDVYSKEAYLKSFLIVN